MACGISQRHDHLLRAAENEIDVIRKRYLKDAKQFKQRIYAQELQHSKQLTHMKSHYGAQVDELSKVVSQLQIALASPATEPPEAKFKIQTI